MSPKHATKRLLSTLGIDVRVLRYRLGLAAKQAAAAVLAPFSSPLRGDVPAVTLFAVYTENNRYPLELTLRSLAKHTRYPNYEIWIADNTQTDQLAPFLASAREELNITRVLRTDTPRSAGAWFDQIRDEVETPFWFGIDNDMIFLGSDWLSDMMRRFIDDPTLDLLSGEPVPAWTGTEPVSKHLVVAGETPSTWVFGVRTSLSTRLRRSFDFHKDGIDPSTGRQRTFDTGGKLLDDMRRAGLHAAAMPWWFRAKFWHVGHLSWVFRNDVPAAERDFKLYQLRDLQRRVETARW